MEKTFCEFFAGIGLVAEGLRRGGWQCIYANDIDAKKLAMYAGHFGSSEHYHLGDVWDTPAVLERIGDGPFLATASFPCTDMSLAGKRRGFGGGESSALFGFLQAIDGLGDDQPRILLLENVPGFLNSHGGADFAEAVQQLAQLGYWLDCFQLDARWFVPQSRPRLFLIGYHQSLVHLPPLAARQQSEWFGDRWQQAIAAADRLRPDKLLAAIQAVEPATGWATVDTGNPRQASYELQDLIDFDEGQPWWDDDQLHRHEAMLFDHCRVKLTAMQAERRQRFAMTAYRRMRAGRQRLEVRFDGLAGCLRTPRGGSAKQIVVVVDRGVLRMRWMTPREYARLQGADDYTLPENTIQGLFGFGDAVCVPVIRWIDQHMLSPVFEAAAKQMEADRARPVHTR